MQVIAERCDNNMTHCEVFDSFIVHDICRLMNLTDQLWTGLMSNTEPPMKCPFEKTTIKIKNAIVDLGYIAHLPLSGYTWKFTFKSFKTPAKVRRKKRFLSCIAFQVTVTKARPGRKKTSKSRPN